MCIPGVEDRLTDATSAHAGVETLGTTRVRGVVVVSPGVK